MRCMSCQNPMGRKPHLFQRLLICKTCKEMADKAEREIKAEIAKAEQHAMNWLAEHIMRGGLFAGESGNEQPAGAARRILEDQAGVPQLQSEAPDTDP
jgi:hypothetical protein